jgi:hypothetical protein
MNRWILAFAGIMIPFLSSALSAYLRWSVQLYYFYAFIRIEIQARSG